MNRDIFNIEEELGRDYVQAFRDMFDEEEYSKEKLVTAFKFLNTLIGGLAAHRKSKSLMNALEHIDCMSSRFDDSGLPVEYSYEELYHLMVKESEYLPEDFDRVLEKFRETKYFLPSPKEFIEFHEKMKGNIVHLEKKVEETTQALERSQREVKITTQEKDQALQQKDQALQQKDQALQQKDQALQEKDKIIQQERERFRELEQTPEKELQRRVRQLEEENQELKEENKELKEENHHLLDSVRCKICLLHEVQMLFIPCRHLISCHECAPSLGGKCPICRKSIQSTVRVYF